jgi:hypothetical protein
MRILRIRIPNTASESYKTCLILQGSQDEVNRLLADMAARESEMSRTVQQTEQQTKLIRELQE